MHMRTTISRLVASCSFAFLTVAAASATTLTGSFTTDDQSFQYVWNLSQASTVTAATTSYASGGFVPVLSLFDNTSGAFIAVDGGAGSCANGRGTDPTTGICNDAYLKQSLAAGSYRVVLTQFDNFPNGSNISAGFSEMGNGNFTAGFCNASGPFQEIDLAPCVQRTGNYSLNLNAANAAVPEPGSAALVLPALAFAAWRFSSARNRKTRPE